MDNDCLSLWLLWFLQSYVWSNIELQNILDLDSMQFEALPNTKNILMISTIIQKQALKNLQNSFITSQEQLFNSLLQHSWNSETKTFWWFSVKNLNEWIYAKLWITSSPATYGSKSLSTYCPVRRLVNWANTRGCGEIGKKVHCSNEGGMSLLTPFSCLQKGAVHNFLNYCLCKCMIIFHCELHIIWCDKLTNCCIYFCINLHTNS